MMIKNLAMLRTGAAAIAASAVLSPAFAQEVDPTATVAAPTDVVPTAETTVEPVAATPVETDALAPTASEVPETAPVATTNRPIETRAPARSSMTSARQVETVAAPVSTAPAPQTLTVPLDTAVAAPPALEEAVTPIAPTGAAVNDDLLPIAAGAGVGLLALAGLGMAMRRRRRTVQDDVTFHQPRVARTMHPATEGKAGQAPLATVSAPVLATNGNWIKEALRGPTPDNPFLSLKKRLKRAAFFEQRERQVRQGIGARVSPMAGLPQRLANSISTRVQTKPMQRFHWA